MDPVTYFQTVKYNPSFRIIYSTFFEKGRTQWRLPGCGPPQIEI